MKPSDDNPNDAPLSDREAALERLLDRLADDPRATVDPSDEDAVREQRAIDATLRRAFRPPEPPAALLEKLSGEEPFVEPRRDGVGKSRRERRSQLALAATLLIGVGAWAFTGRNVILEWFRDDGDYDARHVAAIYSGSVADGFEPDWFCEDETRFADTFDERQGKGVWLRPLPEGVRMAGLAYFKGLSPNATSLLAWVDETPVLVMVDRTSEIPPSLIEPFDGATANVYTSQLGDLTVVEVSPLDAPRVAPSLYLRDPPRRPTGRVPGS